MTNDELTRLDTRLDGIDARLLALTTSIERSTSLCTACRHIVMGNGQPGLDTRVTRLEERDSTTELTNSRIDEVVRVNTARITRLEERDATRLRIGAKALTIMGAVAGMVATIGAVVLRWVLGVKG